MHPRQSRMFAMAPGEGYSGRGESASRHCGEPQHQASIDFVHFCNLVFGVVHVAEASPFLSTMQPGNHIVLSVGGVALLDTALRWKSCKLCNNLWLHA